METVKWFAVYVLPIIIAFAAVFEFVRRLVRNADEERPTLERIKAPDVPPPNPPPLDRPHEGHRFVEKSSTFFPLPKPAFTLENVAPFSGLIVNRVARNDEPTEPQVTPPAHRPPPLRTVSSKALINWNLFAACDLRKGERVRVVVDGAEYKVIPFDRFAREQVSHNFVTDYLEKAPESEMRTNERLAERELESETVLVDPTKVCEPAAHQWGSTRTEKDERWIRREATCLVCGKVSKWAVSSC